jgi:hypothetical protein
VVAVNEARSRGRANSVVAPASVFVVEKWSIKGVLSGFRAGTLRVLL